MTKTNGLLKKNVPLLQRKLIGSQKTNTNNKFTYEFHHQYMKPQEQRFWAPDFSCSHSETRVTENDRFKYRTNTLPICLTRKGGAPSK
jgi:hypothetical protein